MNIATVVWLVAAGGAALGQSLGGTSRPSVGGVGLTAPAQPPLLLGEEDSAAKRHYGPTGQACLSVTGSAIPQTINPHIFEHVILAKNVCGQLIKLEVCYYKSDRCIPMAVPPYSRKELVLGIMPAMKEFRFEYRELFQ